MTKQVQRRRGTTSQHTSFTGAEGEISVNTSNKTIHVHDGSTAGGFESALANLDNVGVADVSSALAGVTNIDINGGTIDGTVIGNNSAAAITGTTVTGTSFVSSGNMTFGDNDKAIFGTGSDLQIYHDGSNSYIDDIGTGDFIVRAENNLYLKRTTADETYLHGAVNGAVTVYYNGSAKLATNNTGVDVTGTITSDGLAVDGGATSPTISITGARSGTLATISNTSAATSNGLLVSTTSVSANSNPLWVRSNSLDRLKVAGNGDISFYATDGITQAFYWDAADERLGLGTTTPARPLSVSRDATSSIVASFESANTQGAISFQGSATTSDTAVRIGAEGNELFAVAGGTERVRVTADGNMRIGNTQQEITGLTQTNLVVSSESGGEIVTYRKDNGVVAGDFVGAFLFGNDDNAATEDHFAGMWAKSASTNGSMNIHWAAGRDNYETDTPQMTLDNTGALIVDGTDTEAVSSQLLKVRNSTTGEAVTIGMYAIADNGGDGNSGSITFDAGATGTAADNQLRFSADHQTDTTPDMVIKGSGNVGIGTDNPSTELHIKSTSSDADVQIESTSSGGDARLNLYANSAGVSQIRFGDEASANVGMLTYDHSDNSMAFRVSSAEAMRISSGNLLVGKTVVDNTTQGARIYPTGRMSLVSEADDALILNRRTTDGDIAVFRRNGATVGSIGSYASARLRIGSNAGAGLIFGGSQVYPATDGAVADNTHDLGTSSYRWKNLHLSGGVVFGDAGGAGTSTGNTLDSYEQGTWVPTLGGTATYTNQSGTYTKIGDQVTFWCYLRPNILGTGSTTTISGLPFNCANAGSPATVGNWDFAANNAIAFSAAVAGTSITVGAKATATNNYVGVAPFADGGTRVRISGTYKAT